jgi:tetrahydromethanopterin S-methyltransferase subunit H
MMEFKKEQETINISGIKFGGRVGENPTVLIGSIFNKGEKLVLNEKLGVFNKEEAEKLIYLQKELADKSGNPCMLDIYGTHEIALQKYVNFVANLTNGPFLLNVPSVEIRINLLKYAQEIGLSNRVIYNSINYTLMENEIIAIRNYKIKSALIQSLNPRNPTVKGMLAILRGNNTQAGLIEKSKRAGIKNILLFTSVFEVPTIGIASRGIYDLKEEFGFPTGTAPVGIIGRWCLKNETFTGDYKKSCEAAGVAIAQAMGADYIIYGSLKKAEYIFPAAAIVDAMISLNSRSSFGNRTINKEHPLKKLYFPLT